MVKPTNQSNADLVHRIWKKCDVYPKPDTNEIYEELSKVQNISDKEYKNVDKNNLVKNISFSLDMKKRLETNRWIKYHK